MADKKKRLQTVLAHAGVASRRSAAELIESGKVRVNGRPVTQRGFRVDPDLVRITVSGREIPAPGKKLYFLFNKPGGVITTVRDTHNRRKVTDFFKGVSSRIYPVGRLDKDTTGALLLTNDGALAHKLSHPRFGVRKEYIARTKRYIPGKDVRALECGVEIDEKTTSPCRIKLVKRLSGGAVYKIELHEGRKRQIRRMFERAGGEVAELKRVKYAGLSLKGLKEGEYRELTEAEVKRLLRSPSARSQ